MQKISSRMRTLEKKIILHFSTTIVCLFYYYALASLVVVKGRIGNDTVIVIHSTSPATSRVMSTADLPLGIEYLGPPALLKECIQTTLPENPRRIPRAFSGNFPVLVQTQNERKQPEAITSSSTEEEPDQRRVPTPEAQKIIPYALLAWRPKVHPRFRSRRRKKRRGNQPWGVLFLITLIISAVVALLHQLLHGP